MKCIILAGSDAPIDQEKIRQREAAEGERYLWGTGNKALLELEDLQHNRFRAIERPLNSVKNASSITDWVVVGPKEIGDFVGKNRLVEQGKTIGDSMRSGLDALIDNKERFTLVLFSDLVMATSKIVDELVGDVYPDISKRIPKPSQIVSYVRKATVGNFPRRYFPFWISNKHIWAKEGNFLFLTKDTNLDVVDIIYSNRKLKEGESQRGLVSNIVGKCPGYLAAGALELLFTGGIWMDTFNDGFAQFFDEKKHHGYYPNIIVENKWRELQMDLDSEQDAARLGLTIVGNLEYKMGLGNDTLRAGRELKKLYSRAAQKVMLEPDASKPRAYVLVSRWDSRDALADFESRHRKDICRLKCGMDDLGWYGR